MNNNTSILHALAYELNLPDNYFSEQFRKELIEEIAEVELRQIDDDIEHYIEYRDYLESYIIDGTKGLANMTLKELFIHCWQQLNKNMPIIHNHEEFVLYCDNFIFPLLKKYLTPIELTKLIKKINE